MGSQHTRGLWRFPETGEESDLRFPAWDSGWDQCMFVSWSLALPRTGCSPAMAGLKGPLAQASLNRDSAGLVSLAPG